MISEKTGDAEYQDNRSVLSSRGSLASSLTKSEHSIELAQLTSHVASAMHAEKGEAEGSEPPYKTARSGDIVMVIDGETFCVPEEDVPKVYYEEDDDQVLPTEQVHEGMQRELQLMKDLEVSERILRTDVPSGKKIYSNGDDPFAKVKGLISDMIARLEEKASADATHKATSNVCTAQVFLTNMTARYVVYHRTDGLNTIAKRVQGVPNCFRVS